MTYRSRYQAFRQFDKADQLAEFERQDRLERRLTWFSVALGVASVLGWVVVLV